MTFIRSLPEDAVQLIRAQFVTEYATVSAAGVPIDTPLCLFPSADLSTLDVATGLAYPAKAERARRNPKVGLLIEGGPTQPVVSVAGMAAVHDADLQANTNRYLTETIVIPTIDPKLVPWSVTEKAVWYLTRIIVAVTPVHIRWWKNPAAMDDAPQAWRAPANMVFPKSDPAPPGTASEAPKWPQPPWQERAKRVLDGKLLGHLTLLDAEGYPLPIRVRAVQPAADGFDLVVPKSVPWSKGKATLSFDGREIFVGDATVNGAQAHLRVERLLPVLPLTEDTSEVIQPTPDTQAKLMKRLEYELARRKQSIPKVPAQPPEPTPGAKIRGEGITAYLKALQSLDKP